MYINNKFYYQVGDKCHVLKLETDKGKYGFFSDLNFDNWYNLIKDVGLPISCEAFIRLIHLYNSNIHFIDQSSFQSSTDVFNLDIALDKIICKKFDIPSSYSSLLNHICQYDSCAIYLPIKILNFPVERYMQNVKVKDIGSNIYKFKFEDIEDRNEIINLLAYKLSILGNFSAIPTFTSRERDEVIKVITSHREKINSSNLINNTVMTTNQEKNQCTKTPNNIFGNMFGNMNNIFQGMNMEYGAINDQSIAISPKGICFFNPETQTYKAWDSKNKELIDMAGLAMPGIFFKMPISKAKLKEGDILLINGEYRIFDGWASKTMKLINPLTGVQTNKQKETNLFNIIFFTKVSCMFNLFDKMEGKGMESLMMMQMLGGGMQGQDMMSTYFQFKMMSSLMGGENDLDLGSLFEAFKEEKDKEE